MHLFNSKLTSALQCLFLAFFLVSCFGDDDDDNDDDLGAGNGACPVGEWTIPDNCPGEAAFITFNENGLGVTTQPDCNNICAEPASVTEFLWSTSGSSVTLDYTGITICGTAAGVPSGDTLPFSCSADGSTLTLNGVTWVRVGSSGSESTGGGGTGGGTGTTGDSGQVAFWTASETLGGSHIDITLDGETKRIDKFFVSGSPTCGQDGAVTFTKEPGTYDYSGTGQDGSSWEGSAEVKLNGCLTIQLTE